MIKELQEHMMAIIIGLIIFVILPIGVYYADKADEKDAADSFHIWEKAYGNPNGITHEEYRQLKNYNRTRGSH